MQKSESIDKLAMALNKFQAEVTSVKKTAVNSFFKSKYADLDNIWDAIRKPLTSNGLSVAQSILPGQAVGSSFLETILLHTSGQFIAGQQPIVSAKADAQSIGSAITYSRRYSLSAILGLTAEDDDGNAATGPKGEPESERSIAIRAKLVGQNIALNLHQAIIDKMEGRPGKDLPTVVAEVTSWKQ